MSDRKDEKLNNGDLREIKSLIGDADSGGFSLDDILAEFGGNPSARPGGPTTTWKDSSAVSRRRRGRISRPWAVSRPRPPSALCSNWRNG